jgi:YbgC/YbaW family acyl-CoA thioester hydrolase
VDRATGQPARLAPGFAEVFAPAGQAEALGIRMSKAQPTTGAYHYRSRRRVQFHELDPARHASHLAYLEWVGQAYFEAIRAAGHPVEQGLGDGCMVLQAGHDIEYLAPALDNESIEVESWICELGRVRGAWTHEIHNASTGRLLARNYSLGVFVNPQGRPIAPPGHAVEDVVRGPAGGDPGPPTVGL